MQFSPKRYCIFIDDDNRERAVEMERAKATSFSGLVRDLIRAEYDRMKRYESRHDDLKVTMRR
jgi:hypothetical protein